MKKYIIKSIFIICITSVFLSSCTDVLDQSPVDSFNEESLFQDINLVEAFLYQCYDVIGGDREEVLGMREDLLSSATDELLNIHRAGQVTFTKGNLTPDYLGQFGDWRLGWLQWDVNYLNIKNVNTILGGIDDVPVNTEEDTKRIEQIKAESYFIRAFNYTNLLRSYGGVILIDKKFNLDDDFTTQTRATLQETLDFILRDLDKAIAGLPLKGQIEQGRATKGAAAALKSRLLSFVSGELTNGGYESTNPLVSFQG
ncbi:MAG: RagB/SusD family nutrient uptake outer membrane protein, partial [Bacteroidales bacterium]|nr:RagB/SusD family nutrient uptake outer membrane protein [Bacteroidales bacterium]